MSFKAVIKFAAAAAMCMVGSTAVAGPSWTSGIVFDHTSVPGGLLIRFNATASMPDNCPGPVSSLVDHSGFEEDHPAGDVDGNCHE